MKAGASASPVLRRWIGTALMVLASAQAIALDGEVGIHDPSTVARDEGRFYVYGTGNGLPFLVSDDGWSWKKGGTLLSALPTGKPGAEVLAKGGNNSWAPDLIRVGEQIFLYYSAPGTQPKSAIGLLVGRSLDPRSPRYQWRDAGPVVWSDGVEDSNAIDPGVFRDDDGRLWLTYGSYFGFIRLVELDPKTGLRREPRRASHDIAVNSEASVIVHHDDWYYLFVTHGSCCVGANSTYNIRVGRARKVTGPYVDRTGIEMLEGGGTLFAGSRGRHIGPGHFGLLDVGDGVQKFSLHYEADLDRGGVSVLDIRPLGWRDGWPVAGDNLSAGTYSLASVRTGNVLELAVDGRPAQAASEWPASTLGVRLGPAMLQLQQKWTIAPVDGAGGYPGSPFFKIVIAGTERALAATAAAELTTEPAFTGAPEQLWRIDQLSDGSYRLMPKSVPGSEQALALSAIGGSTPTLQAVDGKSDRQRWHIELP